MSDTPYYNPAQDPVKLEELTMSPGGVPTRWVRLLTAEVIALRAELTASKARVVLSDDERTALRSLLDSAMSAGWDYYKPAGWAGKRLYNLLAKGAP